MLSPDFLLSSISAVLLARRSTLVAEAVTNAYGGFTILCDRVATQEELYAIRDGATPVFPAGAKVMAILPTSTSYLKLVDVPYLFPHTGQTVTPEKVMEHIRRSPAASSVILTAPLRVVRNSAASDTATVYLNIADTVSGARAKEVVNRPIQMGGSVAIIRAAKANPGVALCQRCWKWGHPSSACRALQAKCPLCMGPHSREHHRTLAGCCKGNAKTTPPTLPTAEGMPCPHPSRCVNCRKDHPADSRKCNFWRHRFDQDWIKARYTEVSERHRSKPPRANTPAASGGRT